MHLCSIMGDGLFLAGFFGRQSVPMRPVKQNVSGRGHVTATLGLGYRPCTLPFPSHSGQDTPFFSASYIYTAAFKKASIKDLIHLCPVGHNVTMTFLTVRLALGCAFGRPR